MPATAQTPAVWLPAPVILLLCFIAGWALNLWWPARLEPPSALWALGWLYNLLGIALDLWCFVIFRQQRTAILPHQGANQFVVKGPYRWSRNPMYLGLIMIHVGASIATGILWHVATLIPAVIAIRFYVIAREEQHLLARFGSDYRDYCEKVPRWF